MAFAMHHTVLVFPMPDGPVIIKFGIFLSRIMTFIFLAIVWSTIKLSRFISLSVIFIIGLYLFIHVMFSICYSKLLCFIIIFNQFFVIYKKLKYILYKMYFL